MTRSHASIVPATVTDEADIGGLGRGPGRHDPAGAGDRCWPAAPSPPSTPIFMGEEQGRILHQRIDLGIATDTPDGLFVPVLRDVGDRDAADLRRGLDAMKADVRKRSIPRQELVGQTITLSNFGMFGGRHAQLVVLPPQVAILGAGRVREAVRVRDGKPAVTRVLPLSLTFDHRAVMGGEAARFLASVIGDLERAS